MQLRPGEQFTIVRQLDNPADTGTYYVQAVIRKSKTDTIITTLRLEDKGGQRFSANWQVVDDPSGEGMWIDFETQVFTDTGYSVYSDVYAIENAVHLIEVRKPVNMGGSSAEEVDYNRIESIVRSLIPTKTTQKQKKVDLQPILDAVESIKEAIVENKPDDVDISPIQSAIEAVMAKMSESEGVIKSAIESKEVTPETDLTPVLELIRENDPRNISNEVEAMGNRMKDFFNEDVMKIMQSVSEMYNMLKDAPFIPLPSKPIGGKEKEVIPTKRVRKT